MEVTGKALLEYACHRFEEKNMKRHWKLLFWCMEKVLNRTGFWRIFTAVIWMVMIWNSAKPIRSSKIK